VGDYFLVTSRNSVQGVSQVYRYNRAEAGTIYIDDLSSGNQRAASFDPGTGAGQLLTGEGTYKFVIGPDNKMAMDQTNNNKIDGDEAQWVFPGGTRADFGPGFTVRIITPRRLFDDATTDEVTKFNIVFGSDIDLVVPSPQTTLPGYEFKLISSSGGVRQGLTKYGILFTWDKDSDSDELDLIIPGARARSFKGGAQGEVYITLERERMMKPLPQYALPPPVCGNAIIDSGEFCDPPGSDCADPYFGRSGVCADDCKACALPECGNGFIEVGEECESNADCVQGYLCNGCKCEMIPLPVCGNMLLENGEQCEQDVDCGLGADCSGCVCVPTFEPVIEVPAPVPKPTFGDVMRNFWAWLTGVFGA